ncbi:MAG: valine--tRNA ligase [Candidatus Pacearchaeota archaeon]
MVYNLKKIKTWNTNIEKEITEKWKNSEKFKFNPKKEKIYSIDTPPPYVNAPIHIGQAVTYCYMDFFARYKRMKGFEVLFPLGLDRNGLPIEMAAEKKFKISPFKDGREKFIEACRKLLENSSDETMDTFSRLGISFTSYKEGNHIGAIYKTDSPEYRSVTQATFIELFKKGLIYEDARINNWDPKLRTTLADSEIDYKEKETFFNEVKWKVKETGEEIIIGTTRPELICTCGMVIFNPKDERYQHLEGKTAISPIFGKEVQIKAHPLADIEKGTGIAMMCSAGDLSDIQFFREESLKPKIAIEKDGTMNKVAGPLEGLKVREARKKIIDLLKEKDLLVKQDKIIHRTPVSERSGAEIEFIEMPEYYLKQFEFKNEIKKISNKINFYPKSGKKLLKDWINSISIDWPISRRRFYATPIPLWVAEKEGKKIYALGKSGEYHEPWREKPKKDFEVWEKGKKIGLVKDFKVKWKGEERVFDTWMDSSISELVLLKYGKDEKFFDKAYPCSLRPQGKEIVRTWLYYTLLRGYLETGRPAFKDVWINQHIVDDRGHKMSKSKGNVIDPQKLLDLYGGEAIRFWAATEGDLAENDLRCSEERIKGELKTLNKLLNISKFVMLFEKPKNKPKLMETDKVFINWLEHQAEFAGERYENYDFHKSTLNLRYFIWDVFASHYIELVKSRAYNKDKKFTKEESDSAKYSLHYMLEKLLRLLYPIIPQITETIAREKGIDLMNSGFPRSKVKGEWISKDIVGKISGFNREVWKKKNDKGISLRDEISGIKIPKELKFFERDLKATHNLV